ncbi:MAG TPA: hypothetical protein VGN57_06335 [Pirellulaceae bacterium]|jgi:hypothetical protein|nr:hypothetical protein [Pirellulaceae bacterium]
MRRGWFFAITALLICGSALPTALAQPDFYKPPIAYDDTPSTDVIEKLRQQLEASDEELPWDERHGWLPALLEKLEVPESSQTLVFSKTSLQIHRISRRTPRALYFNDDVYVGWVPGGDVIELSAVDPELGAVFYTVDQTEDLRPQIVRDKGECMTCHASSNTNSVPGYLVRSVFAGGDGRPHFGLGTQVTDWTTDFKDRYGGWYVTGTHGDLRHRGNVFAKNTAVDPIDAEAGANIEDLARYFEITAYRQPTSDIVALMTLEHQTQMHNLITAAEYETRSALAYDNTMNEALERPADHRSDTTTRRIESAGDELLAGLLFSEEFRLTSPVAGNSDFAGEFSGKGPRDERGRSLREFDLQTRLFKYPCSFLIYSPQFDGLPDEVRSYVYDRLIAVLNETPKEAGAEETTVDEKSAGSRKRRPEKDPFVHLSAADRLAIREILVATKPEFAERFAKAKAGAASE